VTFFKYLGN